MATWFTSDLHFGHKNILKHCEPTRGQFYTGPRDIPVQEWKPAKDDIAAMNEHLIERWNERVGPNDDVYDNGDLAMMIGRGQLIEILDRLNGRHHLTLGNHDDLIFDAIRKGDRELLSRFASIENYREIKVEGQKIVLCHFPFRVWNGNYKGVWNLYGHCHGSLPGVGKAMDVGYDSAELPADFRRGPIPFELVKSIMDAREFVALDHHTEKTH